MSEHTCPADHRHGETLSCYSKHKCRCTGCRQAKSRYTWKTSRNHGHDVSVPATGTRRRLQALAIAGYSTANIADKVGAHSMHLNKVRRGVIGWVRVSTATKIDRAFRELVMTPRTDREGAIVRTRALANGWAPALAFDDIDRDPEPQTDGATRIGEAGRISEIEWLREGGVSAEHIAKAMNRTPEALERWAHRHGHKDLAAFFHDGSKYLREAA